MKRISTLCLTLLLGTSLVHSQQGPKSSPQEILDKMVSVYASCSSYADEGEVKTTFFEASGRRTINKPFATAFVRPSRFRFEFAERDLGHYIVWRDESVIKSWWTIKPKTRHFETLWLALAGAAGVSDASAIKVPSMLMGDLQDAHIIQKLTQLVLRGEKKLGDRMAYWIEGRDWQNRLLKIWIDKESFLLLKVHEKQTFKDFRTESTTTYQPRINTNISPDKLAFNH